jgi:hypothetical protein
VQAAKDAAVVQWRGSIEKELMQIERGERSAALAVKVQDAAAQLEDVARQPQDQVDFTALKARLQELIQVASAQGIEDSAASVQARNLLTEISKREVRSEARRALDSTPRAGETTSALVKATAVDPHARFDCIGDLVYRPMADAPSPYQVQQGGKLRFYVKCSSNKYDLNSFM